MGERRPPPNIDGMTTLKVDNISYRATPEALRELFSPYGEIGDVYIPRSFGSNEPRGFAFVRFAQRKDAEDALRALDNTEFEGRTLAIQEAKERRPENPRGAMGGRYGGRDERGYRDEPRDRYRDDRGRDRDRSSRDRDRSRDRDNRDRRDDRDRDRDYPRRDDRRDDRDRGYGGGRGGDYGNGGRDGDRGRDRSRSPYRSRY